MFKCTIYLAVYTFESVMWLLIWVQLSWPIPGRITLTGAYGEMRKETMHLGIDISVGERIGEVPVLAAADGYVHRIRVSHTGFGKVVYVRHPQGILTVYGHLSHFAPQGERIIQGLQAQQGRFEVEKYLKPTEWPVRRGDTLGWAGNSGYSFGPHLHFEVRTLGDQPLSPLRYLPPVPDTTPPVFFRLGVMPLAPESQILGRHERVFCRLRQGHLKKNLRLYIVPETLTVAGPVGFLYSAGDRAGGGSAWLGLRTISVRDQSGKKLFSAQWETLDFDWRRFLRWHIDYAYQRVFRIGIGRLYEPTAPLPWSRGRGVIELLPDSIATFTIEAEDFAGNSARVEVVLRGVKPIPSPRALPLDPHAMWSIEEGVVRVRKPFYTAKGDTILPNRPLPLRGQILDTLFSMDGKAFPTFLRACIPPGFDIEIPLSASCRLRIHKESLQDTLYLRVEPIKLSWGSGFVIGDPFVPLRFAAELHWELPDTVEVSKSYPLFRPWNEAVWSPITGATRRGRTWVIPVRSWGAFILIEDRTPPQVRPLKAAGPFYLVSVEDFGSGVHPYSFRIIAEKGAVYPEYYEPQRILYLPRRAGRTFRIEVSDRVGNHTQAVLRF